MSAPDHPSLPKYVQYLGDYATHFNLWPYIHLSAKVLGVERNTEKDCSFRHKILISRGGVEYTVLAERLVVTSGLHVKPNIPEIPGLNSLQRGEKGPSWIHSSEYHSPSQLKNKKVLILGSGETGMDVAYEAIVGGAEKVWMGIRGGCVRLHVPHLTAASSRSPRCSTTFAYSAPLSMATYQLTA
jgi:dimethylaniline monooxygenase (N-oxide forming)